ncbi:MAG: type III-B CRISPR-associated protein Cas10/Cmr2 [Polyangiaceae bacterium]|nr:type III-B CRISPR-associated protein Cas10/Cmr2 [Polyangiaceae bacterium]
MSPRDEAFWRFKARALATPSPSGDLRGEEPLLRAARDARDANAPLDPATPARESVTRLHPLSAAPIGAPYHRALLEEATLSAAGSGPDPGKDPAEWYRERWLAAMEDDELPATPWLPDHSIQAHRSLTAALAGARDQGDEPALLYLHVGPVQGFISAARRTHDLWVGSYTITYLTYRAAEAIARDEGPDVVVYPDLHRLPLARKCLFQAGGVEPLDLLRASIANRILAVVPRSRADDLAAKAAEAAAEAWRAMAGATRERLTRIAALDAGAWEHFDEQIDDHLEVTAVVQPWPGSRSEAGALLDAFAVDRPWPLAGGSERSAEEEGRTGVAYGALFDLVHRVLAAQRKVALAGPARGDRRPKCAQCGKREQMGPVVEERDARSQQHRSRKFFEDLSRAVQQADEQRDAPSADSPRLSLQLSRGEGLCAVCLTKRFAPQFFYGAGASGLGLSWRDPKQQPLLRFPSVPTIASAPLRFYLHRQRNEPSMAACLRPWTKSLGSLLADDALRFTPPGNLLPKLGAVARGSDLLDQEGAWLYESAYDPAVAWRDHDVEAPREGDRRYQNVKTRIEPARDAFRSLLRALGGKRASSYFAVLMLDGDQMGQWLVGTHRRTPTLAELGIAGHHRPRPTFPALHGELSRRLAALASALHRLVDDHLGRVVYSGGDDLLALLPLQTALPCLQAIERTIRSEDHLDDRVTISAGLSIAHIRDPLSHALEAARGAERAAKASGRNRFSIRLDKRAGVPIELTLPWAIEPPNARPPLDVVTILLELLAPLPGTTSRRDDEERRPLLHLKVAHRLVEEVEALGAPALRDAFLCRLDTLLGLSAERKARSPQLERVRDFIHGYLDWLDGAGDPRDSARRIVDLLLFARFLAREEHGIDTRQLLEDLKQDLTGAER